MATIAYRHTITDGAWFDAVPVMGNFNRAKAEINGELDEGNFSAAMDPTVKRIQVSEEVSGALILPVGDLEFQPGEGRNIDVRLESAPATHYLRVGTVGVQVG